MHADAARPADRRRAARQKRADAVLFGFGGSGVVSRSPNPLGAATSSGQASSTTGDEGAALYALAERRDGTSGREVLGSSLFTRGTSARPSPGRGGAPGGVYAVSAAV